jgi:hypothetical protein
MLAVSCSCSAESIAVVVLPLEQGSSNNRPKQLYCMYCCLVIAVHNPAYASYCTQQCHTSYMVQHNISSTQGIKSDFSV